jgi:hypothetical protein
VLQRLLSGIGNKVAHAILYLQETDMSAALPVTSPEVDIAALVRDRWGDLLAEVSAGATMRDSGLLPLSSELLSVAGEQGLQAFALPEDIGGEGADPVAWGKYWSRSATCARMWHFRC